MPPRPVSSSQPQAVPVEEEKKETSSKFSSRNDVITMDLEWMAILKATQELMPIGKHKFDFEEYIHPLQIGHQDIIIKKEEAVKKLSDLEDISDKL